MNNVLQHIVNDDLKIRLEYIGKSEGERIEKACMDLYKRFCSAFKGQYINGNFGAPSFAAFLAFPEKYAKCLYQDIGSLIKNKKTGDYALVEGWGLNGNISYLKCTGPDGKEIKVCADDFEAANIPSSVMEIAKAKLRKQCPIMCPNEGAEDEN